MNQYVKMSIDGRRQAIEGTYDLGKELREKVDKLFKEIEKMGSECKDAGEFETKFTASPLNQKYTNLFTEIATKSQMKGAEGKGVKSDLKRTIAGGVAVGVAESALDQAKNAVIPTRAAVHPKAYDKARKVPVLGDAIDIGQKASYAMNIGKLFGARKKKKKRR